MKPDAVLQDYLAKGDLSGIQAVLIGCLDKELRSEEKLEIYDLAESLNKETSDKLFEKDDGKLDLPALSSGKDSLRTLKAALRMNFSREKLQRACKIIEDIKAAAQPEEKQTGNALDTELVTLEEKPVGEAQEALEQTTSEKTESEGCKSVEAEWPKQDQETVQSSNKDAEVQEEEDPEHKGDTSHPSTPKSLNPVVEGELSKKSKLKKGTGAPQRKPLGAKPGPRHAVGYWERQFSRLGRSIDEFLSQFTGKP